MKRKTVIAIYMRLSQDDGDPDAESNSIVNQRHLLYSYVEKNFEKVILTFGWSLKPSILKKKSFDLEHGI